MQSCAIVGHKIDKQMEPGICYIKEEYLLPDEKEKVLPVDNAELGVKRKLTDEQNAAEDENGHKTQKLSKKEQSPVYKQDNALILCHSLFNGAAVKEPCTYENCRYLHDMEIFLKSKPDDIGDKCPVFDATGYCKRGVTCRFSHAHIDERGQNIKTDSYDENKKPTSFNGISFDIQKALRKREYDFARSKKLVAQADKVRDERKKKLVENSVTKENGHTDRKTNDATDSASANETAIDTEPATPQEMNVITDNSEPKETADVTETAMPKETAIITDPTIPKKLTNAASKPIGAAVDDSESSGRDCALKKSPIDFANKLILSPLTTVGNLPFRRICKEFGADITCGEMACAAPIVKGLTQEWALTKRHISEDIFGVQLCGNNPNIIAQAAQVLQETAKIDYIDLNIGCPIELIYNHGGGSALMRRTNILETVVRSCSTMSPQIPFTVKMRTGVYADKSVAHELMPLVEEWGAAAVTLHGRSREQRYTKSANWQYIEECAAKVKHIPVIGNGDILNFEDYNDKRAIAPHVSSVMIGRGALIKPWIFKEIKEQKPWNPSSTERFEMLRTYVNYGLEHWGTDTKGVENTRRFLLEWQSFLYRYIPYELLAQPPQQINQRPQKFRGRDEMETLMSSPNSEDWVRLSEMLLGPRPDDFKFVPKHKANAY